MANLGFRAIYGILVHAGVAVERAFLPDRLPLGRLRTLEGGSPLSAFDVVAFSVSFEDEYVHVLDLLAAAGIPPYRHERDDRASLIAARGPATFPNPEPLTESACPELGGRAGGGEPPIVIQLKEGAPASDSSRHVDQLRCRCFGPRIRGPG